MPCVFHPLLSRLCTARLSLNSASRTLLVQKSFSSASQTDEFRSVEDIAAGLKEGLFRRTVVMSGAGVSTASGIPDFRSPGSGLYDNLHQYDLPYPEAIFDIHYFAKDPRPFYQWMQNLCQRQYKPNQAHFFVRLLQDKGLLLRNYTQNIDGLERMSGVLPDKLVEAHGTVSTSSCIVCHKEHSSQFVQDTIMDGGIPHCTGALCNGLVKPDIVFFGEMLPHRFYNLHQSDLSSCDLLVVMGTSLEVHPFASLVDIPSPSVPRLLVNKELVGPFRGAKSRERNDVVLTGDIVQSVQQMVELCSWTEDLSVLNCMHDAK